MQHRRVAITGLGVVSPLGNTVQSSWNNLLNGCSGISQISHFDARYFSTSIAAEVKNFMPSTTGINGKNNLKHTKYSIAFTRYALEAANEAINDANIRPKAVDAYRWGLVVGSGMMTTEFDYLQRFQQACAFEGKIDWSKFQDCSSQFLDLADFGKTNSNSGLALLIQEFGIEGYATSVHTACASGGQALGLAMQVIRRNEADCVLAGGFDSMITQIGLSSFCLLGALSTYNTTPETASRPFDATRNGFVLGEGAAFLVLEEWDHAIDRGAKIYAELAGEGNSLSSYRITDSHPNGDGAMQAIRNALQDAQVSSAAVDYINAHGTSTKMNDLSETNAIKTVFGAGSKSIPISSTKSQTGHLIAAAGALEAVFSVLAIQHSTIPKTANLITPDPECDLDYVVDGPRRKDLKIVLSNSFGFGGSNSCLLFKHPEFSR